MGGWGWGCTDLWAVQGRVQVGKGCGQLGKTTIGHLQPSRCETCRAWRRLWQGWLLVPALELSRGRGGSHRWASRGMEGPGDAYSCPAEATSIWDLLAKGFGIVLMRIGLTFFFF